jgi:hypothetical protein
VTGNSFVGSQYLVDLGGAGQVRGYTWSANTWVGGSDDRSWRLDRKRYDWNAWRQATGLGETDHIHAAPLREPTVFVRPNRYEPGRAHLVIYNWDHRAEVPVDVSQVLRRGDRYEVRNVQALFDKPVVSGVYSGGPIVVPMTGVVPPEPLGGPGRVTRRPPRTGPAFDVFLLTTRFP